MKRLLWSSSLLLLVSSVAPRSALAMGGTALLNEGVAAKPLGTMNAVAAQADDPSALFFNPAGLTQMRGYVMSINNITLDLKTDRSAPNLGDISSSNTPLVNVPSVFAVYGAPEERFAVGLGLYSDFGLETRWAENSFARYTATLSRFHTFTVNPTVAVRVSDQLSAGVGIEVIKAFDVDLRKKVFQGTDPDGDARQTAEGTGIGSILGLRYTPSDEHAFGFTYRLPVRLRLDGKQELTGLSGVGAAVFGGPDYQTDAKARVDLPAAAILGWSYRPQRALTFETDVQWTGWSSVDTLHVQFADSDPTRQAVLRSGVDPARRDWKDALSLGTGVSWIVDRRWTLRGGLGYFQKAVPDKTFEPGLPDANRYEATIGASRRWESTDIHLAYNPIWFQTRHIENNVTGGAIDGTYKTFIHVIMVGVDQRF